MSEVNQTERLESAAIDALRALALRPDGEDVVSSGAIFSVVGTGDVLRVFLNMEQIEEVQQEPLAEAIGPLVESIPGVRRVVVKPRPQSVAKAEQLPGIGAVVAVHSGKGGVGKSTVTANLACALAAQGWRIGLLDADVYGPSGPTLMGLKGRAEEDEESGLIQPKLAHGVKLMSLGYLLPEDKPLIWRGSLVDEGLPQLFSDVNWGELDLLLLDLPPGTSDVHLAVAQQVALSGVITVSAPGQTSVEDVRRGMEMFADMAVPSLGLIENFAGVLCHSCGHQQPVFGDRGVQLLAEELGVPMLAQLPFTPSVATASDAGRPLVVDEPTHEISRPFYEIGERIAKALIQPQEDKTCH